MTGDAKLAERIKRDYRTAAIEPPTRALLDHAVRLTRAPAEVSAEDVARLREAGWTDEEVLAATHIVGFFNHYVRLAEGLGVEPEAFMERGALAEPDVSLEAEGSAGAE